MWSVTERGGRPEERWNAGREAVGIGRALKREAGDAGFWLKHKVGRIGVRVEDVADPDDRVHRDVDVFFDGLI